MKKMAKFGKKKMLSNEIGVVTVEKKSAETHRLGLKIETISGINYFVKQKMGWWPPG